MIRRTVNKKFYRSWNRHQSIFIQSSYSASYPEQNQQSRNKIWNPGWRLEIERYKFILVMLLTSLGHKHSLIILSEYRPGWRLNKLTDWWRGGWDGNEETARNCTGWWISLEMVWMEMKRRLEWIAKEMVGMERKRRLGTVQVDVLLKRRETAKVETVHCKVL